MEKVLLSKSEKRFIFSLLKGQKALFSEFSPEELSVVARSLEHKGFVRVGYIEGGYVEAVRLSAYGHSYLEFNPALSNPITRGDVTFIIGILTFILALAGFILGVVACSRLM